MCFDSCQCTDELPSRTRGCGKHNPPLKISCLQLFSSAWSWTVKWAILRVVVLQYKKCQQSSWRRLQPLRRCSQSWLEVLTLEEWTRGAVNNVRSMYATIHTFVVMHSCKLQEYGRRTCPKDPPTRWQIFNNDRLGCHVSHLLAQALCCFHT